MDSELWTQLFDKNRENLISDINTIIVELQKYCDALKSNDNVALKNLIEEGSTILNNRTKN